MNSTLGQQKTDRTSTEYFNSSWRLWLFGFLLVAVTIFAYLPALSGGFVWDDDSWTTDLIDLFRGTSGLHSIWFQPTAMQQYYPLSGTTFWLDYHLWEFWTTPYHVENVSLHILAALLFWRLLVRLHVPGAWLASAIFALHPVMVQSVAWITERKNVLSLAFYLGALLAYERYTSWVSSDEKFATDPQSLRDKWQSSIFYGLAFVLFLCALLAKTTAFSLPAVILLIGWWKRGQIRWRADVLPTLPFFALAFGMGAITIWLEKNNVGAQGTDFALTFPHRCVIAGQAFWFYLGKMLWPANLCFVYPRWQPDTSSVWQWLYPATAVGTVFTLWLMRRSIGRGPVTALLFYVGTLFPLLGFINGYAMRYSFVWNHWVYLPALGIIALAAALVVQAGEALRMRTMVHCSLAAILLALAVLTWRQSNMFSDNETLWRTTLARNPTSWMVYNNLGGLLLQKGEVDQAVAQYRETVALNPNDAEAQYNLGKALLTNGSLQEAINCFKRALAIRPRSPKAEMELGRAFSLQGQFAQAIEHYQAAIHLEPNNGLFLNNLAWLLATCPEAQFRNGNGAVRLAERACHLTSYQEPQLIGTLAAAYAEAARFDDAIAAAEKAYDLAFTRGKESLASKDQELLQLFKARQPYREQLPAKPNSP